MSYSDHIRACNTGETSGYLAFWVAGFRVGWLRPALARRLAVFSDILRMGDGTVELAPDLDIFERRTAAVEILVEALVADGVVPRKRREHYPVLSAWGAEPLLSIDRAAVTPFGVVAHGIHVNGFVRRPGGGLDLWIGRRSRDRSVAAGKFDNLIAGGQPVGLTLAQNLVKEAYEEAGIGPELAARAVPTGAITYRMEAALGLKVDCLFVYDLDLDSAFVPRNTDGEVEGFEAMPWQRVAEIVRDTDDFKFNCNLVIIDFLIRHGLITPNEPGYLDLCHGLRRW